ncbi:bcl-2-like protein 10 [Gastrophryne carolinensis]
MSEQQLVEEETRALLEDYLQRCLHMEWRPLTTPAAQCLWRVATEMLQRNRHFYESCEQLEGDARSTLERVAARLPEEGGLNWGRLIGLIVFAGILVKRPGEPIASGTPEELAAVLSRFLLDEHREWFLQSGAWEGFCKFCNKNGTDQVQENNVFSNALMAAAGFGLAGLVFLLTVR